MAASGTMQSIPTSTATRFLGRAALPLPPPKVSGFERCSRRTANMQVVKCSAQAEEGIKEVVTSPSKPKIIDLLEFSSPAPERINGRLAMLGFVSAIGAELLSGQDVFSQISHGGLQLFLGATIIFSIASFVPFYKGVNLESKSEGLMNSEAELLNGRLAMLGLVALAVTEFAKGGALV